MKYRPNLNQAELVKRYKRFLADVILETGEPLTIHCPNTGSMKHCWAPDWKVWFSTSDNKKRKYPNTLEIIEMPQGHRVGVNTGLANKLVVEAIEQGVVEELQGYESLRTEVPYGQEKSRIDILLEGQDVPCYVEVKSVTLLVDPENTDSGCGAFPDAVSTRGTKHLRELIAVKQQGFRAVLFYCVQHTGISSVRPADEIDPEYGSTLREALESGVEVIAYGADISPDEIRLTCPLPFYT